MGKSYIAKRDPSERRAPDAAAGVGGAARDQGRVKTFASRNEVRDALVAAGFKGARANNMASLYAVLLHSAKTEQLRRDHGDRFNGVKVRGDIILTGCWWQQNKLAAQLGIGVTTLQYYVRDLRRLGIVATQRVHNCMGRDQGGTSVIMACVPTELWRTLASDCEAAQAAEPAACQASEPEASRSSEPEASGTSQPEACITADLASGYSGLIGHPALASLADPPDAIPNPNQISDKTSDPEDNPERTRCALTENDARDAGLTRAGTVHALTARGDETSPIRDVGTGPIDRIRASMDERIASKDDVSSVRTAWTRADEEHAGKLGPCPWSVGQIEAWMSLCARDDRYAGKAALILRHTLTYWSAFASFATRNGTWEKKVEGMRSAAATFLTSAEGQSHMLAFWSERADTKAAAAKGHKYKGGLKLSDIL